MRIHILILTSIITIATTVLKIDTRKDATDIKLREQIPEITNALHYRSIKDSYYSMIQPKINKLQKQYETVRKNDQIGLPEKKKRTKENKLKFEQIRQKYLFISVLLVLILLFLFIYAFSYYRKATRVLQKQSRHIMEQQIQIKKQNEKLHKAVDTQNKLFSIIAHDLRSPLISVSNLSKLIGFYIHEHRYEQLKDLAKQIDHKNDQLIDLTDNLLNWTKSQSENLSPFFETVRLNEVIEECLEIYETASDDKEIALIYKRNDDSLLWTDRNMLKTICRNLINNAIKFTPRGGKIKIFTNKSGQLLQISVRDNGIGLSPDKLKTIFEIDKSNIKNGTEGETGTGLGLSVCMEFTGKLGGTIYAKNNKKNGSCFTFTIPLYNPALYCANKDKQGPAPDPIEQTNAKPDQLRNP